MVFTIQLLAIFGGKFCLENFLLYLFLIIIISCLTSEVLIFNHLPTIFNYSCDIFNPPLLLQYLYCLIWLINLLIVIKTSYLSNAIWYNEHTYHKGGLEIPIKNRSFTPEISLSDVKWHDCYGWKWCKVYVESCKFVFLNVFINTVNVSKSHCFDSNCSYSYIWNAVRSMMMLNNSSYSNTFISQYSDLVIINVHSL